MYAENTHIKPPPKPNISDVKFFVANVAKMAPLIPAT